MSRCKAVTNSGARCKRKAQESGACFIESHKQQIAEQAQRAETWAQLSTKQIKAVEALVDQRIGETLEEVAHRGGVSRVTLWRYMQDPAFVEAYRTRVEDELGAQRSRVARALVEGACTPGRGQGTMQKIFWQRLGELVDKKEHTGAAGGPVEHLVTFYVPKNGREREGGEP